jgi:hypothetical protein
MPELKTYPVTTDDSPWFLNQPYLIKPARQLHRLRPVRLGVIANGLRNYERQARLLQLIGTHFPEELQYHRAGEDWYGTLSDFLRCVSAADWFEVDWAHLDYLNETVMNDEYDRDNPDLGPNGLGEMADYITFIPVRFYNFTEEQWANDVAENFQSLCLIRGLTNSDYMDISSLLIEYEIYDNFDQVDVWANIDAITPQTHPEPLCWLPDVARFCCRKTGNMLLDTALAGPFDDSEYEHDGKEFLWSTDIETVKLLYQEAAPVWERVEKFLKWADDQAAMEEIAWAMLGSELGGSVERVLDEMKAIRDDQIESERMFELFYGDGDEEEDYDEEW